MHELMESHDEDLNDVRIEVRDTERGRPSTTSAHTGRRSFWQRAGSAGKGSAQGSRQASEAPASGAVAEKIGQAPRPRKARQDQLKALGAGSDAGGVAPPMSASQI